MTNHEPDRFPEPASVTEVDFEDTIPDRPLVDKELWRLAEAEWLFRNACRGLRKACDDSEADATLMDAWGDGVLEAMEAILPNHDAFEAREYYLGIYKRVADPHRQLISTIKDICNPHATT